MNKIRHAGESLFTSEFVDRFHTRWQGPVGERHCYIWTGAKDRKGYGVISYQARMLRAPRVAWALAHGEMPPADRMVCHHCDTPACVNPTHLFLGTASDNTADMVRKGRVSHVSRSVGTANPAARVTPDIVREIRALRRDGLSLRKIASRFGISDGQVNNITSGKHWRHVA